MVEHHQVIADRVERIAVATQRAMSAAAVRPSFRRKSGSAGLHRVEIVGRIGERACSGR